MSDDISYQAAKAPHAKRAEALLEAAANINTDTSRANALATMALTHAVLALRDVVIARW